MRVVRQIAAVVKMNLLSLPQRLGSSLVIVIGIAGVVAVLIAVLAMAVGFQRTVAGTGSPDRAIIVSGGALSETLSRIGREAIPLIETAPGIAKDSAGRAIADAQILAQVQVPQRSGTKRINLTLRGVGPAAAALRPEIHVIEGRMHRPGLHELTVGRNAAGQYGGLSVGSRLQFQNASWEVVGIFRVDGASTLESEVLTDGETLLSAFQRNWVQSVTVRLENRAALDQIKQSLASDQRLRVDVHRESDYAAAQSKSLSSVLQVVGYFIGTMMAIGALFGAVNTLYAAVNTRSREIATLRALGFGAAPVVASVLIEALLLALAGASIGALVAWSVFDGNLTSMTSGGLQSQLAFVMQVPPQLIVLGMLWACVIGTIAGLFAAWGAARLPVARALSAGA